MLSERLDETTANYIRATLPDQIQWFQNDFIREPSTYRNKEIRKLITSWTRPLEATEDLRLFYPQSQVVVFAEHLTWDTSFFGYRVVRLEGVFTISSNEIDYVAIVQDWLKQISTRGIGYIFVVAFPEDLKFVQALSQCGFDLIETRLTYHRSLTDFVATERYPVRMANREDIEALGLTAQNMVNPYDRFHADPFIPRNDANRLMKEWVRASIEDGFSDCVIVPNVPTPKAFCTVKTYQTHWRSWGINLAQSVVLGAVDQSFRGWYQKLISESNLYLQSIDAQHVFWKTQITNRAAIRTAEKLGYRLGRSEFVWRKVLVG